MSFMCPCWMPTVARARSAPRFWAIPAAAKTVPSSVAVETPKSLTHARAHGCTLAAPPIKPTGAGISM